MNKLYQKSEVNFAIAMIVIYVLGTGISETITANIGIAKLVPAVFHAIFAIAVLLWTIKHGYAEKYGLTIPKYELKRAWFFVPLALVACASLFFGIKLQYSPLETILYVISMIGVGFLEEIIFRGFLFIGMAKTNVKSAVIVSSLTFGIGHIANLFSGQQLVETIIQIVFAVAVGFTLVIIFYKGKSLLPCIIFHALNNSLSAFEKTSEEMAANFTISAEQFEMIWAGICIILLAIYSLVMIKKFDATQSK